MIFRMIKSILTKIKLSKYKKLFNFTYDKSSMFASSFKIKGCKGATISFGKGSMMYGKITCELPTAIVKIGERSFINKNTNLISAEEIDIGNDVTVAWDVTFYDHNAHSFDWKERCDDITIAADKFNHRKPSVIRNWDTVKKSKIKVCDKAWIGFGASILRGVTIGEGAIVGAESVVRDNVEPYTVVFGNPAVKVGEVRRS